MKKIYWLVAGIIGAILLLFLFGGSMMMGGRGYGGSGGMMGNLGYSPSPFGWIGMIFLWLIPVGVIALAAFGIVWLVRNTGKTKPPSS